MLSYAPLPSHQRILTPPNTQSFPSKLSPPPQFHPPRLHAHGGGGSPPATDLKFVLHDALDAAGIDTTRARDARNKFMSEIEYLTAVERETSIAINRRVNLLKTALYIGVEDDSIVSQSADPIRVGPFISAIINLTMNFCTEYSSSITRSSPDVFLNNLETYLFGTKGFRRSKGENLLDPRTLYLHTVLKEGIGSVAILSLIYCEVLKVLRMWQLLDFDCDILFPTDRYGFPRGFHKRKLKDSDQPHIITTLTLLQEMLRNMKETYWPFQHDYSKTPFLRAANCIHNTEKRGLWFASAPATSACCGDMRLALSACERLILLESDPEELRDYSVLLYHCGFFDQSLQYLKLYKQRQQTCSLPKHESCNKFSDLVEDAVDKLMTRLTFISMEEAWS